jgi:hypothetical protein
MDWMLDAFDKLDTWPKPLAFLPYVTLLVVGTLWAGGFLFYKGVRAYIEQP